MATRTGTPRSQVLANSKPPRGRKPKPVASSPEELKAKLVAEGEKAAQKEVKKLAVAREASAKTKAKTAKSEPKMTAAETMANARAALAKKKAAGEIPPVDSAGNQRRTLTAQKLRLMATTGMTPLEFLTAVYRDQLYTEYDVEVVDASKGLAQFYPKMDPTTGELLCEKVNLKIEQRIAAATSATPYVHRKMPIGIDGGEGKPLAVVTADRLAQLSDAELDNLLNVFGKLGVGAQFEGHEQRPYGIDTGEEGGQ